MITFFHIADVHLGVKLFAFGPKKAELQREAVKESFRHIVEKAIEMRIDLLLISGDLFDSHHVREEIISFAKIELKRLKDAGIFVAIAPGTHDPATPDAIWRREDFLNGGLEEYVTVFLDPANPQKIYKELDLTVWAQANTTNKSPQSPLAFLQNVTPKTRYNVAMAHGSVAIETKYAKDDFPIQEEDIARSAMDYVALGHWHGTQDMSQKGVTAWYAGSPEITYQEGKGGLGAGHFLKVVLDKERGEKPVVEVLPSSRRIFEEVTIDLSGIEDETDLRERIAKNATENTIRIIDLTGLRSPNLSCDAEGLEREFEDAFFLLRITDKSHIETAAIDLLRYPEELAIGQFVRLMKQEIDAAKSEEEKQMLEKALALGIAELEGKNVINV